jgi:hypothetical protein
MSTLAKILIALVIIFVVFGAVAVAGLMYIGHRVHEKATEYGLTKSDAEREVSDAQLRRIDGCKLLSKAAVSAAVKMEIVRAENAGGENPGCMYDVLGDPADMTAKHITAMHKTEMSKDQQNMVEQFASTIFKSGANSQGPSEHPGEAPVLTFSIDNNAAELQMKLNQGTLGRLGPGVVSIPGLGDEAFDAYGAMMFVRKGDKLVRIMYMECPCGVEDVVPLARAIVAGL